MLQSAGICGKVPSFVLLHSVTHARANTPPKVRLLLKCSTENIPTWLLRFCSRKPVIYCFHSCPEHFHHFHWLSLCFFYFLFFIFLLSHHWKRSPLMSSNTGTAARNKRPAGPLSSHIIGPHPGNHTMSPDVLRAVACHEKIKKKWKILLGWEWLKLAVTLYFLIFHLINMFCFGSIFSWVFNFWKIVALVRSLLCRNVSL